MAASMTLRETTEVVGELNRALRGWANDFNEGPARKRSGPSTRTPLRGCAGGYASSTSSEPSARSLSTLAAVRVLGPYPPERPRRCGLASVKA
jgi:hypothetical protein